MQTPPPTQERQWTPAGQQPVWMQHYCRQYGSMNAVVGCSSKDADFMAGIHWKK